LLAKGFKLAYIPFRYGNAKRNQIATEEGRNGNNPA
jgi:hypothetical protein